MFNKKDFLDLTTREQFVINSVLSIYELIIKKSFFKRFSLSTHRFRKVNRFAFYERAIGSVRCRNSWCHGFGELADEAEFILSTKRK